MSRIPASSSALRPQRGHTLKGQTLRKYAQATIGSGDVKTAVKLPEGEDLNEWLAMNCVEFYNEISLLYGTVIDFCTDESCPIMSAGTRFEYLWADGEQVKTPVKVSAPKYVDLLMDWIERQLADDTIFPTSTENPFPRNFKSRVRTIMKRLFRVYAHIYHSHFQQVISLGMEAHLNSCFKHFMYFVLEFALLDKREMMPLRDLIHSMLGKAAVAEIEARRQKKSRASDASESRPRQVTRFTLASMGAPDAAAVTKAGDGPDSSEAGLAAAAAPPPRHRSEAAAASESAISRTNSEDGPDSAYGASFPDSAVDGGGAGEEDPSGPSGHAPLRTADEGDPHDPKLQLQPQPQPRQQHQPFQVAGHGQEHERRQEHGAQPERQVQPLPELEPYHGQSDGAAAVVEEGKVDADGTEGGGRSASDGTPTAAAAAAVAAEKGPPHSRATAAATTASDEVDPTAADASQVRLDVQEAAAPVPATTTAAAATGQTREREVATATAEAEPVRPGKAGCCVLL